MLARAGRRKVMRAGEASRACASDLGDRLRQLHQAEDLGFTEFTNHFRRDFVALGKSRIRSPTSGSYRKQTFAGKPAAPSEFEVLSTFPEPVAIATTQQVVRIAR
jgi:hypothetical protein